MSKKKGIVSLILTVAVLVFLAYTAVIGIGPTRKTLSWVWIWKVESALPIR